MRLPDFTILRPDSVEQALDCLTEHGEEAAVYMGGTELLMVMKLGLGAYSQLVDCKRIDELQELAVSDGVLRIGAAVTHRRVELSPDVQRLLPSLAELETGIANVRVRNVGTLCGNLCFAEPHSDPATLLIALGASVEVASRAGLRTLPLEDFVRGPLETALEPAELVTRVLVPIPGPEARIAAHRLAFRERPAVNLAVVQEDGRLRVCVGAVGPRPVRAREAEQVLARSGRSALEEACELAAVAAQPRADINGSAALKTHLVKVLMRRAGAAVLQ